MAGMRDARRHLWRIYVSIEFNGKRHLGWRKKWGQGGQICIPPAWGGLRISTPHCCKAKPGVELWWSKNGKRSGAEVNGIHINVVEGIHAPK
jgi:hypothetical protein